MCIRNVLPFASCFKTEQKEKKIAKPFFLLIVIGLSFPQCRSIISLRNRYCRFSSVEHQVQDGDNVSIWAHFSPGLGNFILLENGRLRIWIFTYGESFRAYYGGCYCRSYGTLYNVSSWFCEGKTCYAFVRSPSVV